MIVCLEGAPTFPKTNMSPKKGRTFNRTYIFQPLIFSGRVSFLGSSSFYFLTLGLRTPTEKSDVLETLPTKVGE